MHKVKFGRFMERQYPKSWDTSSLYVLCEGDDVLYVGISSRGIWQRWFGDLSPHISIYIRGGMNGNSDAGRAVVANLPASLNWTIELWTQEDCAKQFKETFKEFGDWTLRYFEDEMIQFRQPSLNSMGANYRQTKAAWEIEQEDQAIKKALEAYRRNRRNS